MHACVDDHMHASVDDQQALCSVEGISIVGTVVETLCYTVIIGYNVNHYYPVSTYGDVFACWLQDLLICGLLAWYRRPTRAQAAAGLALFCAFNWWVISGRCGMQMLVAMQVRECIHDLSTHIAPYTTSPSTPYTTLKECFPLQ
jgi:hypothetical protein